MFFWGFIWEISLAWASLIGAQENFEKSDYPLWHDWTVFKNPETYLKIFNIRMSKRKFQKFQKNLHFKKIKQTRKLSFKIHKRQKKQKLSEFTKRPTKLKDTELRINFESPKNLNIFQSRKNTNFQNLEIFRNGKNSASKKVVIKKYSLITRYTDITKNSAIPK